MASCIWCPFYQHRPALSTCPSTCLMCVQAEHKIQSADGPLTITLEKLGGWAVGVAGLVWAARCWAASQWRFSAAHLAICLHTYAPA